MSPFPTATWHTWLEDLQTQAVALAWADEEGEPRGLPAAADWPTVWREVTEGARGRALRDAGWPPEVLALAEIARIERVGAGPAPGPLRAGDGQPSVARAALEALRSAESWETLRWQAGWRAYREPLPTGLGRFLRALLLPAARREAVEEARRDRPPVPWAPELQRLAADSAEGALWVGEAEVDGAPGWRVRLEVAPELGGDHVYLLALVHGEGPVPTVRVALVDPEGHATELSEARPSDTWYRPGGPSPDAVLAAWAIEPG